MLIDFVKHHFEQALVFFPTSLFGIDHRRAVQQLILKAIVQMKQEEKKGRPLKPTKPLLGAKPQSDQPEPSPLEIVNLKKSFELEEKISKKWGRLSFSIIAQINLLH